MCGLENEAQFVINLGGEAASSCLLCTLRRRQ